MPLLAALHLLLVIVCGVHVIRSGQPMYWLLILFMFPGLGTLVYVLAVWLPSSRAPRAAGRALRAAGQLLDPQRELREARAALDDTPSAQNRLRLAAALHAGGDAAAAAKEYQACLQGPFAQDAEIRWGAAQALFDSGQPAESLALLDALQRERTEFRAEEVVLLRGRSLALLGRHPEARGAFEAAVSAHGSYAAKAETAIWALQQGEPAMAAPLLEELDRLATRWNAHTRALHADLQKRLTAARR